MFDDTFHRIMHDVYSVFTNMFTKFFNVFVVCHECLTNFFNVIEILTKNSHEKKNSYSMYEIAMHTEKCTVIQRVQ